MKPFKNRKEHDFLKKLSIQVGSLIHLVDDKEALEKVYEIIDNVDEYYAEVLERQRKGDK